MGSRVKLKDTFLLPVSTTLAKLVAKLATCVVDTGGAL